MATALRLHLNNVRQNVLPHNLLSLYIFQQVLSRVGYKLCSNLTTLDKDLFLYNCVLNYIDGPNLPLGCKNHVIEMDHR